MRYGRLILAAAAGGVYLSLMYINPYGGVIPLSEMTLQLSGSRGTFVLGFSTSELMSFSMRLFPAFLFELYAGIRLYRHFCTASIYVFSRYPRRVKWYLQEAGRLAGEVCLFQLFLLLSALLVTVIRWELQVDQAGIALLLYHFLIQSLWIYIMALAVNLCAVYIGSSAAYGIVICAQMVCIVLFYLADLTARNSEGLSVSRFLIWNPLAHLVLGWHGSGIKAVNGVLEPQWMGADLNHSLLLFAILAIILTAVGACIVKNHELLVSDSERSVA